MRKGGWAAIAAALLLAGCSNAIVPRGAETAGTRPAPDRAPSRNVPRDTGRPPVMRPVPVRQPTAAVPVPPVPGVMTMAGATTALAAGIVAGPPVATLPIADDTAANDPER